MRFQKTQILTFVVVIVLLLTLLALLGLCKNVEVWSGREDDSFSDVQGVTCQLVENADSPAGQASEYTFTLDTVIAHDTSLTFYASHQLVDVWVGDEYVYSLQPSEEISFIKTVGSSWIILPIYREDAGKTVRVVMTPVYKDHLKTDADFYLGSSKAVYRSQLRQELPAMVLSVLNIFVGLLLLVVAIYCLCTKRGSGKILSLSMVAITMGLWQFAHNDFSPFMSQSKPVFLYYVSVTMMLVCIIPLVSSAGFEFGKGKRSVLPYFIFGATVMAAVQILLQLFGILDLREMFPFTHGSIILGALLLIGESVWCHVKGRQNDTERTVTNNAWILGVGALVDLIFYYVRGSSSGLVMVLSAVLCFVLMEGAHFMSSYLDQSRMLAEKEIQLTHSRVVTMMSQIRSHFVFNILNAISGMCKYDPEKADEVIVRFAHFLRNNIDIMEDDRMLPFTTELQHLEDYVVLEQVRFGDRLNYETDIQVTGFMIPPMILQPIVENAIKHGITKKQTGGTIVLSTWEENGSVKIRVDDDGVGFEMRELEKEKSVGLKNIQFRLRHLVHGTLEISSEPGKGTSVLVSIPREEVGICE